MDAQYQIYTVIMYVFLFMFGACVGSFLNVCIYRLPKGESLIKSNSHCMTCGTPILKRDLIPIVSWCMLRGKCRACKAPIAARYTVVESLNGIGWVLIGLYYDLMSGMGLHIIFSCLVYSALIVVFFMDWDTQLISTPIVIFIAIMGIPDFIFCREKTHLTLSEMIIGLFAASVPLLLIYLFSKGRAMGLGDVYLMAGAGFFLGYERVLAALFIGVIVGAIAGVIIKSKGGSSQFAFGPWLSIGILIAMIWGWDIVNWYLNFTGFGELLHGEGYISQLPAIRP